MARKLTIAGGSVVVLASLLVIFLMYADYSEGIRAGVPVKFSRKGVIFKTYEGELNVGGLTNSSEGAIPTTWAFTVRRSDEEVRRALEQAMTDGSRVKLHYAEKYVQLFWRGDTKYFVRQVEIVDEPRGSKLPTPTKP